MVHLLPVLLLGLTDDAQDIRDTTTACLNQVGERHKAIQATTAAHQVLLLTPRLRRSLLLTASFAVTAQC